ncbi:hypothetical protein M0R45_027884 [Rubus argutus]|uniref:Uncharacterized protein n=1 Tax=Rubus argutus TaxID=59490 RepID=A0AAW1W7M8_RUBAR
MPMAETRIGVRVVSTIVEEKHAPGINKGAVLQAGRAEHNINENVVSTNADAREIADESGLYLFDEKNVSGHVGEEGTDFSELPILSRADEYTDSRISSGKDDIHSNGVLKNEDKIWEQIDAMRSIVGYRGTPHTSCIEELKALYIFTGVEPPTSFNDPPDLAQVNDKLHFLMSIIGLQ